MAAHRYWEIYVTETDDVSNSYCSFSEVELRETEGGADVLTGSMGYTHTGDGAVGNNPAAAVDDNTGTECGSTFTGVYRWRVDLGVGNAKDFLQCVITSQRVVSGRSPRDFQIRWSDDDVNWTTQISFTGQTGWGVLEARTFSLVTATVSGTVSLDGSPVARTIRAYRRDTGALIGSGTSDGTGAFSFTIPYANGEVQLVCMDDAAGTVYNDLIERVTV